MGSPTTCHVQRNPFFSYLFVFESDALGRSAGLISVLAMQPFWFFGEYFFDTFSFQGKGESFFIVVVFFSVHFEVLFFCLEVVFSQCSGVFGRGCVTSGHCY